ncbi:hypothetical protein BCR34DRAFT_563264 [Clohesyomyces aquaticus]|uniref:Uncharacterized protein n=1 Tax=Clohesyomyces aquaticus TaxID=1231657 RepID=A0A1Y1ZR36_9PLEO|nr:hypothetical protein BCR34DRAFT_563264 [Clohesyomyces aquaticus]
MATHSAEFLEVNEYQRTRHRSRSGGHADFLEEQEKAERRDRERQLKRYHDSKYPHRKQPSDRLYVPSFEPQVHRRVQSAEEIRERKDEPPERAYYVREERPPHTYDLSDDPVRPSQLPVPHRFKPSRSASSSHQRKPSIKVEIIQDRPPAPSTSRRDTTPSSSTTPRKSPSRSPRSPSALPQLKFQFLTLRTKLSSVGESCLPFVDVEGAKPEDLTFCKIAEEAAGFSFQLKIWGQIVGLEKMDKIDRTKRDLVEKTAGILDRLIKRATELGEACGRARPRDLKIESVPVGDDEDSDWGDEDEDDDVKDVTDSLGYIIQSHLDGIRIQIQALSRLTRRLQEATQDAEAEVVATEKLVKEVDRFFGSEDALNRYSIDPKFVGKKALEEARYTART